MSTQTAAHTAHTARPTSPDSAHSLRSAITADEGRLEVMGVGDVAYYKDITGEGPPVVLIHSINAAASAYEMRPLFEALRGRRRVFALDLPGFGRSQRGDRAYTPALYAEAIERFLVDVASPQGVPVDAVALSLSSEFLAVVAGRAPSLFRSLTLLSPTGLGAERPIRGVVGGAVRALLRRALHVAPLSDGLFRLLRTEPSMHYFLQKSFVGPVDDGLARYARETAAASGAQYAPLTFVAGELFTPDALRALYAPLTVPTRIVYDQDPYSGFDRLNELLRANPRVSARRVAPSLGMAHFERTGAVVAVIEERVERT